MLFLNRLFFIFLAVVFFSGNFAYSAQSWVESTPKANANYKYYVGRGEADSEKAAFDQAVKDAYDQAARENFPAEYSYQADIYQTETSSYLTERTVFSGISVRFDGFEKEDEYIQKTDEGYNVKLLYRFSKKAIAKEKERLKNAMDTSKKRSMSVLGNKADAQKGILVVETDPVDGAAVYIDGERYGQTPMTLYGALSTGRHTLRIDHPQYQTVTEKIITVPGKKVAVKKTLIPAFATISVTTEPVDADVYLDGRPVGTAPLTYARIPVGSEVTVSFRHPETERMSIPLTLKKNEKRPMNIVLPEKSAKVSFFSFPKAAEIYIDKRLVGSTPLKDYPLARGSHNYTLEKEGYESVSGSFSVKGGESLNQTVELKALSKIQTVGSKEQKNTVPGNIDKYHRYEEIPPPKKHLALTPSSNPEDVLLSAMNWSYPSNFIRARVSYKKRDQGGTTFFIFLSFDMDDYQKLFVQPLKRALKNVADGSGRETEKLECFYDEEKEGQVKCAIRPLKNVSDKILIKSSSITHGFFSDKADFDSFTLMTPYDGRREKVKPYEKRSLILSIYDRSGKKHTISNGDLYIEKFTTDKNRNVIFMPSFKDGYENLVLAAQATDFEPSDISRVIIRLTEGKPADNPYPPYRKRKER